MDSEVFGVLCTQAVRTLRVPLFGFGCRILRRSCRARLIEWRVALRGVCKVDEGNANVFDKLLQ
jgi:hypothetical protein